MKRERMIGRLQFEYDELDNRFRKINRAVLDDNNGISKRQREMMLDQINIMNAYRYILDRRIRNLMTNSH